MKNVDKILNGLTFLNKISGNGVRLFFLGFLSLFLELALIRYLAGSIWNLGYFPNLVLIAAFIGLGLGFIFHRSISSLRSEQLYIIVPGAISLLFMFVFLFEPQVPGFSSNVFLSEFFFSSAESDNSGIGTWFLFVVWFCSTAIIFLLISQYTAKLFATFKPLVAYTLDIGGSCMGILSFMLISWLQIDALYWFVALLALFWLTLDRKLRRMPTTLCSILFLLIATFSFIFPEEHEYWSPYQKISVRQHDNNEIAGYAADQTSANANSLTSIYVNNLFNPHQIMFDSNQLKQLMYQSVYDYRSKDTDLPRFKSALIIGAGTGNDVASALINKVERVDAVEIDPVISKIGEEFHPSNPYQDPRVTVYNTDGRVFLANTTNTYDLIIFSLTDSLVKVSPVAQLRLENYLYTVESIQQAYRLLNKDGALVFYHYYNKDWLLAKVTMLFAYGSGVIPSRHGNVFFFQKTEYDGVEKERQGKELTAFFSEILTKFDVDLPNNDWPFLYLKKQSIPTFYLFAMAFLAFVIACLMWFVHHQFRDTDLKPNGYIQLAFVLMGVAFLLLETKGVIQFSLLFGTTWSNNSLVFLAVLVLVLLANWTAQVVASEKHLTLIFLLLFLCCIISIVVPLSILLSIENMTWRYIIASLLVFSPIYFANLIFSSLFKNLNNAECYFGWNLIGATLGGLLEYFSMLWGYASLAFLVLACYALVFLLFNFRITRLLARQII